MDTLSDIAARQQADRPASDDPLVERLFAELVSLGEEVCTLRDRLETIELLQQRCEPADSAAVDAFVADPELIQRRLKRHRAWFEALFARLSG